MKIFCRRIRRKAHLISSAAFALSVLISPSSLIATNEQSSKASTSAHTNHPIVDCSVDPLQQISASMEALSRRVSPGVVQIFATGYNLDGDREHRNTDLSSRSSISGSGIIIASDGWIVTNAHVVQGGRRIRVRLTQEAPSSTLPGGASRHALFEAKLVVADRDTDLALLKIEATGLPTLELSDSSDLNQGQLVLPLAAHWASKIL